MTKASSCLSLRTALPRGSGVTLKLRLARYFSRAMAPSARGSGPLALHLLRRGALRRDDSQVRLAARSRGALLGGLRRPALLAAEALLQKLGEVDDLRRSRLALGLLAGLRDLL